MPTDTPRLSPAQKRLLIETYLSRRDYRGNKHTTARSLCDRGLFVFEISGSHGQPSGGYALTDKGKAVANALAGDLTEATPPDGDTAATRPGAAPRPITTRAAAEPIPPAG